MNEQQEERLQLSGHFRLLHNVGVILLTSADFHKLSVTLRRAIQSGKQVHVDLEQEQVTFTCSDKNTYELIGSSISVKATLAELNDLVTTFLQLGANDTGYADHVHLLYTFRPVNDKLVDLVFERMTEAL